MNNAAKKRSKCQSTSLSTSCVSRRASTITSAAPAIAVHARFRPARKPAKIDANTTQTSTNKLRSSFGTACSVRSIAVFRNIFRKPKRKMKKLIASPTRAAGRSARENSENGMREKCPMIMFCGLPTGVATADVCARRERDEKRKQRQLPASDNGHHKRCEHQTNGVVY